MKTIANNKILNKKQYHIHWIAGGMPHERDMALLICQLIEREVKSFNDVLPVVKAIRNGYY